jgi:hypothetical protein
VSLLLVDVAIVGGGILFGRWLVRSMRARQAADARASADAKHAPAPPTDALAGFPCKIGDVLVRPHEGDEAWLAGALVFEEDRPVAALFIAPEAGGDRAILVRPPAEITWLAPLRVRELAGVVESAEPPHTLEHGGVRYERTRRLPVKIERIGSGAPAMGPSGIVAEYAGAGAERVLVVASGGQTLAWEGVALREHEVEVLPG